MRVGVYIGNQYPESGGGFTFQDNLIEGLLAASSGHEFFFFYLDERFFSEKNGCFVNLKDFILPHVDLSPLSLALLKYKIEICWFISTNAELVHVPFVYTVWDLEHRKQPFFPEISQSGWDWQKRENHYQTFLPQAAYVITGTEHGKNEICQLFNIVEERIRVIPLPTPQWVDRYSDTNTNNMLPLHHSNDPILFYPAQFWPHKNHITLLKSLKILLEEYNLRFHICLSGFDMGNKSYVQEFANKTGLSSMISFPGFLSHDALAYLYKKAAMLVFPSLFGPDNLPPLEAFAFGCPVIAATLYASHQHYGDAVILVDSTDEHQLADAIARVYRDSDLRKKLIANGYIFAAQWKTKDYINAVYRVLDDFQPYRYCWSSEILFRHAIPGREDDMSKHTVEDIYESLHSLSVKVEQLEADKIAANERYIRDIDALQRHSEYLSTGRGAMKTLIAAIKRKLRIS